MNDFILKNKITSDKFLAYVCFYYLISFFSAAALSDSFFGHFFVIVSVALPFLLFPIVVRNAVFELGGSTQDQSKNAAFRMKVVCAFMGIIIISIKAIT
jgi:hypothetical protein